MSSRSSSSLSGYKKSSTTKVTGQAPTVITSSRSQANTLSVGSTQTDVSLSPYVAAQLVSFSATNMRPLTTLYAFCNSQDVTQYCCNGYFGNTSNPQWANTVLQQGAFGTPISTDANGTCCGIFNVPPGIFKTGDLTFELCDTDNIATGSSNVTTLCSAPLTCSVLNVTNTCATPTTVNPHWACLPIQNNVVGSSNVAVPSAFFGQDYCDPFSQLFQINAPPVGTVATPGVFLTSVEVYFQKCSAIPSNGCAVYICQVTAHNEPDSSCILPFSHVHLLNSQCTADATSSTSTKFTFDAPVYVVNGQWYALVIKPDNNDTTYHCHTARCGDSDIITHNSISNPTCCGSAFLGGTSGWSSIPNEFFKFTLNCALFDNENVAPFDPGNSTCVLVPTQTDYVTILNPVFSNNALVDAIMPGDFCYQAANGLANSTGSTVNASVFGVVTYYDSSKGVIYVEPSTGGFVNNSCVQVHRFANSTLSTANQSTQVCYGNTYLMYNPQVDGVVPFIADIVPPATTLTLSYEGISVNTGTTSLSLPLAHGTETYFTQSNTQQLLCFSQANLVTAGNNSLLVNVQMTSLNPYVSPLIDLAGCSLLTIKNNCDNVCTNYEDFYNSSYSLSTYVSNTITLAEGQDADDLQVTLSAYRPPNTDIQVWAKFLNGLDSQGMESQTWTPLVNQNATQYCDPANPYDYENFTYTIPFSYPMIPTTGTVTTNSTNAVVVGNSTMFGNEVFTGWYVNMINPNLPEVSRQVINVASNTQLTLNEPFNGSYANSQYFIVPPPTTAFMGSNAATTLTGNVTCNNNTLIGNGTLFTSQVIVGSTLQVGPFLNDVVSVTNNTFLTVVIPWGNQGATSQTCYQIAPPGVTYVNNNYSYFVGYQSFQLKIVLQANNSANPVTVNTVTATAIVSS